MSFSSCKELVLFYHNLLIFVSFLLWQMIETALMTLSYLHEETSDALLSLSQSVPYVDQLECLCLLCLVLVNKESIECFFGSL